MLDSTGITAATKSFITVAHDPVAILFIVGAVIMTVIILLILNHFFDIRISTVSGSPIPVISITRRGASTTDQTTTTPTIDTTTSPVDIPVVPVAPILWQDGAYARLPKHTPLTQLLYNSYATISLGYAGLYECVKYMTGESHTKKHGKELGLQIMQALNYSSDKPKYYGRLDRKSVV